MDHVSITVRDVNRSIKFYSEALGMKLLRVSVLNPSPETKYKNAYMYSGALTLEIITAGESAEAEMIGEPFAINRDNFKNTYVAKRMNRKISYVKRPGKRIAVFSGPDG